MKDDIDYFEFDLLKSYPRVIGTSFLRQGGVSLHPYASLNLSDTVGDNKEHVKVNRERVRQLMGISHIVYPVQEHGVEVIEINSNNLHNTHHCDALITQEKDIALAVTHADCQALLLFDPKLQVIGVAHGGWRGVAKDLYAKTVQAMHQAFSVNPEDLIACIGPSLGPCHFEFKDYKKELPREFWDFQVKENYFDFGAIAKAQLLKAHLLEKNIEKVLECTYCDKESFYSFRRDKDTGRHATMIALKK